MSCPWPVSIFQLGFWSFYVNQPIVSDWSRSLWFHLSVVFWFCSWWFFLGRIIFVFIDKCISLFSYGYGFGSWLTPPNFILSYGYGFGSQFTPPNFIFRDPHCFLLQFWGFIVDIWCLFDIAEIYSGVRYGMGFQPPFFVCLFLSWNNLRISWSLLFFMENNLSAVFCWTLSDIDQWAMMPCISFVYFSIISHGYLYLNTVGLKVVTGI